VLDVVRKTNPVSVVVFCRKEEIDEHDNANDQKAESSDWERAKTLQAFTRKMYFGNTLARHRPGAVRKLSRLFMIGS
jgi:hypothetical protein